MAVKIPIKGWRISEVRSWLRENVVGGGWYISTISPTDHHVLFVKELAETHIITIFALKFRR